jgi:hypothetical protein
LLTGRIAIMSRRAIFASCPIGIQLCLASSPGTVAFCFAHSSMITVTAGGILRVHKRTLGHSHMTRPFTNHWLRVFQFCSV